MVTSFNETLTSGTKSVMKNKSLVRKMNVPREMFPVASVLVTGYHAFPQYVVMLGACFLVGWSPDASRTWPAGVLAYRILVAFSVAIALAFSALCVYFRDFGNFVDTINIMVRWSVPMIYPVDPGGRAAARVGSAAVPAEPGRAGGDAQPAVLLGALAVRPVGGRRSSRRT